MLGWPSTLTPRQWRVANGGRSSPPLSLVQDSWLRGEGPSLVLGTVNSPPVHRDRHVHAAATGPSVERRVVKISLHCSTKYGARLENQSIPPLLSPRAAGNRHVSLRISAPGPRLFSRLDTPCTRLCARTGGWERAPATLQLSSPAWARAFACASHPPSLALSGRHIAHGHRQAHARDPVA